MYVKVTVWFVLLCVYVFYLIVPRLMRVTLFPYTTLFRSVLGDVARAVTFVSTLAATGLCVFARAVHDRAKTQRPRSEEHTSELQSRQYHVCRLLLEKKKKQ